MSIHYTAEAFADAQIVRTQNFQETKVVRSFDLPPILYTATIGLYVAFLAVMAFAFQDRGMILPMVICIIYLTMAFGVPFMWVRMKPEHAGKPLCWDEFNRDGIVTHTGVMSARDATGQVLILPVLILGWGAAIAFMAAAVR
jgi:hypothetical protein